MKAVINGASVLLVSTLLVIMFITPSIHSFGFYQRRISAVAQSTSQSKYFFHPSHISVQVHHKVACKSTQLLCSVLHTIESEDRKILDKISTIRKSFLSAIRSNWLVIGEIIVILLAKQNPNFFASGGPLRPEFFISKLGVFTIFFINGIALSFSNDPGELKAATQTNILIQGYNFGFIPIITKILARFYPDPAFRCV